MRLHRFFIASCIAGKGDIAATFRPVQPPSAAHSPTQTPASASSWADDLTNDLLVMTAGGELVRHMLRLQLGSPAANGHAAQDRCGPLASCPCCSSISRSCVTACLWQMHSMWKPSAPAMSCLQHFMRARKRLFNLETRNNKQVACCRQPTDVMMCIRTT